MTATLAIQAQYGRGDLRGRIEDALRAAGEDPTRLTVDDLAPLDEFHLLGRPATLALAELAGIRPDDRVLDIGAGLGGPARLLADSYACQVTSLLANLEEERVGMLQAVLIAR